jgi:hypothetical protein
MKCLTVDENKRISLDNIINHIWLKTAIDQEISRENQFEIEDLI